MAMTSILGDPIDPVAGMIMPPYEDRSVDLSRPGTGYENTRNSHETPSGRPARAGMTTYC
jgi:hypothetical protein